MRLTKRYVLLMVASLLCGTMLALTSTGLAGDPVVKAKKKKLPLLLDLGSTKCKACIAMAPIVEKMGKAYHGQLDVRFIDVWKDQRAGIKYKIQIIPTQIFFSAEGKELWRHIGFISKKDILNKLKKLGYEFQTVSKTNSPPVELPK